LYRWRLGLTSAKKRCERNEQQRDNYKAMDMPVKNLRSEGSCANAM